jgi:hypothetical protein
MVGKAIRYATGGRGGQPLQILAVALTYFAITASYCVVLLNAVEISGVPTDALITVLIKLMFIGPFLNLASISGLLSLFIMFIGIRTAWRLTAQANIVVMGPYQAAPAA